MNYFLKLYYFFCNIFQIYKFNDTDLFANYYLLYLIIGFFALILIILLIITIKKIFLYSLKLYNFIFQDLFFYLKRAVKTSIDNKYVNRLIKTALDNTYFKGLIIGLMVSKLPFNLSKFLKKIDIFCNNFEFQL